MPIFGQVWLWSLASFVVGGLFTGLLLVRPARRRVADLERTVEQLREPEHEWAPDSLDDESVMEFDDDDAPSERGAPQANYLQSAREELDRRDRFPDDFFDPEPEFVEDPPPPAETTVLGAVRGDLDSPPELPQPRITPAVTSRMEEQNRPGKGSTVISRGRIQPVGPPKTGVDWFDPDYDPNAGQLPQPVDQRPPVMEQRRPATEQRPSAPESRPVPVEPLPARPVDEAQVGHRSERSLEQTGPVASGLSGRLDGPRSESMNGVLTPPAEDDAAEPPKHTGRAVPTQPEPSRPMAAPRQSAAPRRGQAQEEQTQIIPVITDETPAPEPAAPAKATGATRTATQRRPKENGAKVQVETRPADNGRKQAEPALSAQAPPEGRALFEPMVAPPAEEKPDTSSTGHADGSATQHDGQFATPGPFGPGSAMPNPGGGSPSPEFMVKASVTALRYCTEENPEFSRIVAEVWFKSTADAERVGFRPLS